MKKDKVVRKFSLGFIATRGGIHIKNSHLIQRTLINSTTVVASAFCSKQVGFPFPVLD